MVRIDDLNKKIRDLAVILNQRNRALNKRDEELKLATQKANKIERFFNNNFNKLILEFNDFIASENHLKFDREPFVLQEDERKEGRGVKL